MVDAVRLRILLVALSGWVNRHQLDVIAYLREENRVPRQRVGRPGVLREIRQLLICDRILPLDAVLSHNSADLL